MQLASEIGVEEFKNNLERVAELALEQIRKAGRGLGCREPYNKTNPRMYSYVARKSKITLTYAH